MKILVTSGGTKVPIDKVRDITNMSSGTFGAKLGTEYLRSGHDLVFVMAEKSKSPMIFTQNLHKNGGYVDYTCWRKEMTNFLPKYKEYEYSTYDEYPSVLEHSIKIEKPDVVVLAAAVSDYGVESYMDGKIRSSSDLTIRLKPLPKVISSVRDWVPFKTTIVGFKLLVDSHEAVLLNACHESRINNRLDMVVGNDLRDIKANKHTVYIVTSHSEDKYEACLDDPNYLARVVVVNSMRARR